jgi:hypothetical protein
MIETVKFSVGERLFLDLLRASLHAAVTEGGSVLIPYHLVKKCALPHFEGDVYRTRQFVSRIRQSLHQRGVFTSAPPHLRMTTEGLALMLRAAPAEGRS